MGIFKSASIKNLEKQLSDASGALENCETRRENLATEHDRAVRERRELLLAGSSDQKLIDRVDNRVATAERALVGIDDAIAHARARKADLADQLNLTRDQVQRGGLAREAEARIP